MSLWAFRFLLWYICILLVQPQNRFQFLHPMHIADIMIIGALGFHVMSSSQEGRPIIRTGPATITALFLMVFSFLALKFGPLQTHHGWIPDIDLIYKNCLVLILVEAMATTVERVWAVQATLLFSTLWWIKGGIRLAMGGATYSGDRIMGPAVSLVENPNGFAYFMTLMIPLYLYFYQKTDHKYFKLGFLGLALAGVYIVLNTGSRTGLLALISVGVFLLPKYGAQHKMTIIVAAVAIAIFASSLGAMNIQRFKSIPQSIVSFLAGEDEQKDVSQMNQDEQSAYERKMKNKHTMALILDYPIFGVGLKANDVLVMEKHHYAGGQVHNEILYAGKQMGLVGMLLYLSFMRIIFSTGRRIQQDYKESWPVLSDLGWTFKIQAVVFMVGGFFSPIPWNPLYLILAGSASALMANLQNQSYNHASETV